MAADESWTLFFFQAEDGIRDHCVTGVQTCALPILGLCAAGPLVEVPESGRLFERVHPDNLGPLIGELQAISPGTTAAPPAPFFARQVRVATENSGRIDPEDLDDYRARDGYRALETALHSMTPAEVIDQVVRSGLRGRGGAGYPTGLTWTTVAKAPGAQKYVICNADEGDPGAFMDRSVLESDPHRVLEGMAIAGYAVGASRGFVYCRAEYPLAVARLKTAIRLAGRARLLGAGHRRDPVRVPGRAAPRRRGVRLRRGDGPDRLGQGRAGHAQPAAAVPGHLRPVAAADPDQQRRDLRQHRPHPA